MTAGSRAYSLCGALQAGILALGMLYGPEGERRRDAAALSKSYEPVKRFYGDFENAFGSRLGHEIRKADPNIPEDNKKWLARGAERKAVVFAQKPSGYSFRLSEIKGGVLSSDGTSIVQPR
jgi:Putative redox-active protein (C_GCAxxG_C_C)